MIKVLSIVIVLGLTGLVLADPPRSRTVAPATSGYTYKPPHYHLDASGSYQCKDGLCRQINSVRIASSLQINPAYVSAYSPDGYDATTQTDILNELRRQGARLDVIQAVQAAQAAMAARYTAPAVIPPVSPGAPTVVVVPPVPAGPPNTAIGLAVMNQKCAACHMTGKLLPEQRFTLLDAKGNLVTLTAAQKLKVVQKTRLGQMPPPKNTEGIPPLTDPEFAAIADLVGQ